MTSGAPPDPRPPGSARRVIIHVDMDAFFVACELRRRPELRGRPVVVGGRGARGVVAAASYEARSFGVYSAMSSVQAQRLCPHAVFLDGDHAYYGEVSSAVMAVFRDVTPLVEPLSLDEAFLDITGALRLSGSPRHIADNIRTRILVEQELTCTVGIAPTKFLAKLGSEAAKPRVTRQGPEPGLGVREIEPGEELAFLHPLPMTALWGVGPATQAKLERLGVAVVGDIAVLPEQVLVRALGRAVGRHLHQLANGIDPRPVVPDQSPKSIGHEETFARDINDPVDLGTRLVQMSDAVAARMRAHDVVGRTITIKVRFGDFTTITRSVTVAEAVNSGPAVARAAKQALATVDIASGVRLFGVSVGNLSDGGVQQLALALDSGVGADASWKDAESAIDEIRARFGAGAIGPAAAVRGGELKVTTKGQQQWGPSGDT